MTAAEILRRARARIDTPEKHTIGAFARDTSGRSRGPSDPEAVCFCAAGAVYAESPDVMPNEAFQFLRVAAGIGRDEVIGSYNDRISHAEVLAWVDRAIALAEQEGGAS